MYANLARQVREHIVERARRARWQVLLVAPLIAGVIMRVAAVPVEPSEGPELADEVLAALQQVSREVAAAPAAQR